MKVRILSMQRVVNYGSFMQAYALRRLVESLGHEVRFSDFRTGTPRHKGEKVRKRTFVDKLAAIPRAIASPYGASLKRAFRRRLRSCFERKAWPELGIDKTPDYDTACDLMIIGSDEVFNYTQNHAFGYVPELFGCGLDAKSIIAFAASAGYATCADVDNDEMGDELRQGFANFTRIGVRDQNTYDLVAKFSNHRPALVIDPTLVYDIGQHKKPVADLGRYLLVYAYEGRLDEADEVAKIVRFANARGLRLISAGAFHSWCDDNLIVSPFEMLSLFENAACVLTDTFHGSIFSIKNHRPFVSLLRGENRWGSNSNKLAFLLSQLELSDRVSRDLDNLAGDMDRPIDYARVDSRLADLRADSLAFLVDSMSRIAAQERP